MTECKSCGRDSGHWIGCAEAPSSVGASSPRANEDDGSVGMCAYGECVFQRRPKAGKGPAPKYCEEHSDPKNRK